MTTNSGRKEVYAALCDQLGTEAIADMHRCAGRLREVFPQPDQLSSNVVLVAYGGGKDSAYALSFIRAVQLHMVMQWGATFRMRVVTMRHAGVVQAVMNNIHRSYAALGLYDDPDCQLLLVDGDLIGVFDPSRPPPTKVVERNRRDVLMAGHRTRADARPTFCNACNLSVADAYMLAASHDGGVDVIVTGDSPSEQSAYARWIYGLARQMGVEVPPSPSGSGGFRRLLTILEGVRDTYFADIYGVTPRSEVGMAGESVSRRVRFFSIFTDTSYACSDHWELLTGYLGFEFDDSSFNFTESDCGNPALMAHLRGLKCEKMYGTGYGVGIREYVDFAVSLMREKQFPERLISLTRSRYAEEVDISLARSRMNEYAKNVFGLSEAQLVCMLYSPFADNGAGLEAFMEREYPDLAASVGDIHNLLARPSDTTVQTHDGLSRRMEAIVGLSVDDLRLLYRSPAPGSAVGLIALTLKDDPHKKLIQTRHSLDGPSVYELISGR